MNRTIILLNSTMFNNNRVKAQNSIVNNVKFIYNLNRYLITHSLNVHYDMIYILLRGKLLGEGIVKKDGSSKHSINVRRYYAVVCHKAI